MRVHLILELFRLVPPVRRWRIGFIFGLLAILRAPIPAGAAAPVLVGDVIINEVMAANENAPPEPPTNWTFPGFDDNLWLTGPGGLGFGDRKNTTDLQNVLDGKALSLYIRQSFMYHVPEPIPNNGFDTGSFASWTVTGKAWAIAKAGSNYGHPGFQGTYYAESIAGGEASVGTLRSASFVLRWPGVEFLMAGYSHAPGQSANQYNYVALRRTADGTEVTRVYAPGQDAFKTVRLDGQAAAGESVYLEVVDNGAAGAYAWLAVDDFRLVDIPVVIDDFESGSFNPVLWDTSGYAWRVVMAGQGYGSDPLEGRYAAKSSFSGAGSSDALTGTLTSKPIKVPSRAGQLTFKLAGFDGPGGGAGQDYLEIYQAGESKPIRRFSPPNSDEWTGYAFDITPYQGKKIQFKVVDQRTTDYGWIGIDSIAFSLGGDAADRKLRLTVDYDDGFVAYLNGTEVARRNLGTPGAFTPCTQAADGKHEAGDPEEIELSADYLQDGENVLAIQAHNCTLDSKDLSIVADLDLITKSTTRLVRHQNPWRYFVGTGEPVHQHQCLDADGDASDWIELYNRGTQAVPLAGWSLTDDPELPRKWVFPAVTLAPGQYLVVFASGKNRAVAGGELHTNFKLDKDGEYLALFDATTTANPRCVFAPMLPPQRVDYSYGRAGPQNAFLYLSPPTPGAPNLGVNTFADMVTKPEINSAEGFYNIAPTVALSCATPGAAIHFTLDGSEPDDSSPIYAQPFSLSRPAALRARALRAGWVPSPTVTRTFLVNVDAALKKLPAISLVGDPRKSLYAPNGVMAIVGGTYSNGVWQPVKPGDYNHPMQRGEAYERPVSTAWLDPAGGAGFNVDGGMRISGSDSARARYRLAEQWLNLEEKFSFRLYFRGFYGAAHLDFPLFGPHGVNTFDVITLRGGHNDHRNPFIRDELERRLAADMGQVVSRGTFANLFVNGEFKGYYNPVERYDEHFFQDHFRSANFWDVIKGNLDGSQAIDGDSVKWNELLAFAQNNDLGVLANYQGMGRRLDLVNFVDYLLVNAYAAMDDWPENNWVAARERTGATRFAFYCWDGEHGFGNPLPVEYDTLANLSGRNEEIPTLYRRLMASPEFRLLFADRIQRHFFGQGALTDANIARHHAELRAIIEPMIRYVYYEPYNNTIATDWLPRRRGYLFQHFTAAGVWPGLRAPDCSQAPGQVARGTVVTLGNPNGAGTIYYTTDGSDPRVTGTGAVSPTASAYPAGGILIGHPLTLKARVANGSNWSPLLEAAYTLPVLPDELIVSEFMANVVGEDDGREWIELYNTTNDPIDLTGWQLADNGGERHVIEPDGPLRVPAHGYLVLGQSADRAVNGNAPVAYAYGDDLHLGNKGDEIILLDPAGQVIFSLGYGQYAKAPTPIHHVTSQAPVSGRALGMGEDYSGGPVDLWRLQETLYNGCDAGMPGADNDGVAVGRPPVLHAVKVARRYLLWLQFDEPLDPKSATDPGHYIVDQGIGAPRVVYLWTPTNVLLVLDSIPLASGVQYKLTVTGVSDAAGNACPAQQAPVRFVTPRVTINEVMYDNRGTDCEWVELHNTTNIAIDLSGWYLTNGDTYPAQSEGAVTLPPGTVIQPYGYLMVNLWNASDFAARWGLPQAMRVVNAIVSRAGALANDGDNLALYDAATLGQMVDGSLTVPLPDLCSDGESLEKIDELVPWGDVDTVPLNWDKANEPIGCPVGLDEQNRPICQFASPGRANWTIPRNTAQDWALYE